MMRSFAAMAVAALVACLYPIDPALACEPVTMQAMQQASPPAPVKPPSITLVYDPDAWGSTGGPSGQQVLQQILQTMMQGCSKDDEPVRYPTADTVFMRHPGLLPKLPSDIAHLFTAAEIARSTPVVIAILTPLTEALNPPFIRYRATLELLLRTARAPDGVTAAQRQAWFTLARETAPTGLRIDVTTDIDFLQAADCLRGGPPLQPCLQPISSALDKDPWNLAARQLRLNLIDQLLRSIDRLPDRRDRCTSLLQLLFLDIENLLRGIDNANSKMALGNNLDALAQTGNVALLLGAAHAYRKAGAQLKARQTYTEATETLGTTSGCGHQLNPFMDRFDAFYTSG